MCLNLQFLCARGSFLINAGVAPTELRLPEINVMAKFRGNIWTRAAGSIGSITFSKARTREGFVQTARDRVVPLNPQTPAQVSARAKLSSSNFIARTLGPSAYQSDWDRAISKLPGYQSLVSMLQAASIHDTGNIDLVNSPPDSPLGNLHFPDTFAVAHSGSGLWAVDWSTELGENGANDDELQIYGIQVSQDQDIPSGRDILNESGNATRSDGFWEIDADGVPGATTELFYIAWFRPGTTNSFQQPSRAANKWTNKVT